MWQEKPFDKRSAWIDLILLANYKDNKFLLGNELIEVKRGSFIISELKLMEKWGWSKTKVRNYLKILEEDNMIIKKSDTKKTTLTIVNYSDYQDVETVKKPVEDHERTTEEPPKDHEKTTKELRKDTNNKENKEKNSASTEKDVKDNLVEVFFENAWSLYPSKKGKGQISNTKKKELYKLGEELERCISRYVKYVENKRSKGFKNLKYQNGSTFFNSGYVDCLDSNGFNDVNKPTAKPPLKLVIRDSY